MDHQSCLRRHVSFFLAFSNLLDTHWVVILSEYRGKQSNHRTLRAQGLDHIWKDGVAIKPTSTMRKAKQDKKESPMKGILKGTYPPQCRSRSVIAFTQRQMQDFQSLAMKLTTELKSMKDLVKGKFQSESEASVATSANENADEVSYFTTFLDITELVLTHKFVMVLFLEASFILKFIYIMYMYI